jgi:alpha-1,2-mannosyltransferase
VAFAGGDPYDLAALQDEAIRLGRRPRSLPYLYPPPFLLVMAWAPSLSPDAALWVWWSLGELCLLVVVWALWRWWAPLEPRVLPLIALFVGALGAVGGNAYMGQANLLPLALVVVGLWQQDRGRAGLGGALVGAACMLKMAPALLVLWMVLRGRWRAVGAAVLAGVALQGLALLVFDPAVSLRFYTEVLPGFGRGDYNGLGVPIDLFANHSVPELFHRLWPSPDGVIGLSGTAQWFSRGFALALVLGLGLRFRKPGDALAQRAQVGAVAIAMLLIPVYTFEHHLVWGLLAAVPLSAAALQGRLPRWTLPLLVLALLAWLVPREALRALVPHTPDGAAMLALRELKCAALLTLGALCVLVGGAGR